MKPCLFLFPFLLFLFLTSAYSQSADTIYAKVDFGSANEEINILLRTNNIHYYKMALGTNPKRKGYIMITLKEYWEGKVTGEDTMPPLAYAKQFLNLENVDSGTCITIYTHPDGDSLDCVIKYNNVEVSKRLKRLNSKDYSLRSTILAGNNLAIPVGRTMPLFVYALPYVDPAAPNVKYYCELTANGIPPEQWWEKYKVEHYIVFDFTFVTEPNK